MFHLFAREHLFFFDAPPLNGPRLRSSTFENFAARTEPLVMANIVTETFAVVYELTATTQAFLVLTTIAVGLRLYTRAFVLKQMAWDDYAMVLAYVGFRYRPGHSGHVTDPSSSAT